MKKKLLAFLVVIFVCSAFAFAAGSKKGSKKNELGIGLNLGYPGAGLAVRYHSNDVRILGAVAFDYMYGAVAIDATGEYIFAQLTDKKDNPIIDFSAGAGLGVGIPTGGEAFYLAFEAGVIANYTFVDVPLSIFLRGLWRPYLTFADGVEFNPLGFAGSLGITYNFDLKK